MNRPLFLTLLAAALLLASSTAAQDKGKGGKTKREEPETPKTRSLPDDKRLLALHLEFVKQAEKLGKEYEGDRDWGKARAVYEEILKLVPEYAPAKAKLAEIIERESTAKVAHLTIKANDGWQDTGIDILPSKPVTLTATGNWVFRLEVDTNADGLTIPKELRDFNPGCLIGMIPDPNDKDKNRPFVVGPQKHIEAERGGRLWLRMYDTDPRDNSGVLKVEVRGTFKEGR